MARLIRFELTKVWSRRGHAASALLLMAVNVFILWYTTLGGASSPGLSAYRRLRSDLSGMDRGEICSFIGQRKETIDGVSFVENVLTLRSSNIGERFAEEELENNPGVF